MSDSPPNTTVLGLKSVAAVLPHLGTALVGLSALAYVVGWLEASAYYTGLGAPWVITEFSGGRLLLESAGTVSTIGYFALLSVVNVANRSWTAQGLSRWSAVLTLVAGVVLLAATLLGSRVRPVVGHTLSLLSVSMWAAAAGLTFGELVTSVRDAGFQWQDRHLSLTLTLVSVGLWQVPSMEGRLRAARDSDPASSKRPVIGSSNRDLAGWRLVAV